MDERITAINDVEVRQQQAVAARQVSYEPVLIGARINRVANGFVVTKTYNHVLNPYPSVEHERDSTSVFANIEDVANYIKQLFNN